MIESWHVLPKTTYQLRPEWRRERTTPRMIDLDPDAMRLRQAISALAPDECLIFLGTTEQDADDLARWLRGRSGEPSLGVLEVRRISERQVAVWRWEG